MAKEVKSVIRRFSIDVSVLVLILVISSISVFAASDAGFTNDQDMIFGGTSGSPGTYYLDAISPNADVGIELCDEGSGNYVGGFYAINVSGTMSSVLVTFADSSNALALASTSSGGSCFTQSGAALLTVSASSLTTPNPDVYRAAFPGRLWVGWDSSSNPGTIPDANFFYADNNAELEGSYTSVPRSFNQVTRDVTVSTPTMLIQADGQSFSKSMTDSSGFGVSSDRQAVIGVCEEDEGALCSDGQIVSSNVFPLTLSTGLSAGQVNDQQTHTRYVVINGLGSQFCVGANLQASVDIVTPDPVYFNQTLSITVSTNNPASSNDVNGGNVDISTDFTVRVVIQNSSGTTYLSQDVAVTSNIASGGSTTLSPIQWTALGRSGNYTITVTTDVNDDITECVEGDNTDTDTFELLPVTLPDIYIDGTLTRNFPYANVPYNMSFNMKNSDNDTLSNATVVLKEVNGLNLMAPTQVYNHTINGTSNATGQTGLVVENRVTFTTDYAGNASFTFVPTYNQLYDPTYGYADLSDYIGDYYLVLEGSQENGQAFFFVNNSVLSSNYSFSIVNTSYAGPYADKNTENKALVAQMYDFIYQTYINLLETYI